jgi:23S rRNA (uridine2552-2'-O)-methyltransferase
MREHIRDPFVRRAQAEGYRSRAAFKLLELAKTERLFRRGMAVVELGSAPGGWSQVVAEAIGPSGRLIAIDLLAMAPVAGVEFVQGDFRSGETREGLESLLEGRPVDLVLSDMAPNLSGIAPSDQARSRELCESALEFACAHLRPGGTLLVKAFQGAGFREFMQSMRRSFASVASRKPAASRDRSAETYLLGKGFKAGSKAPK